MNRGELLASLARLEATARELEPDADRRRHLFEDVGRYAEAFLSQIDELPAFVETEDKGIGLYESPIREEGRELGDLLAHLERDVDRPGLNPASAGHLGYIAGGGLYASALGDYLAAVTNRFAGVFYPSPGAVRMENMLLDWMRRLVGYPDAAAGNLTSGGSISNLIGVVTARDAFGLKGRDFERAVVYGTEQVHHSVEKALRIAGLGETVQRRVPMDARYRMRADALSRAVSEDRDYGLLPFLVVASAGTTDTGVVDPLEDIASVSESHALWLHVDAAYGGLFLLCEHGRKVLAGIERSHSIVMDPHKTLFLPYGSGAVLVRDGRRLFESHRYQAAYMQDALETRDELASADLSPELSKHFRGLRLWLPLLLHGVAPFRAALEEKMLLARYFHERLSELPRFEVGPYPDLSVVIFRYVPESGDPEEANRALLRKIHEHGRVFLSSTVLNGRFTLRLAAVSFRTHLDTIDETLRLLESFAAKLG